MPKAAQLDRGPLAFLLQFLHSHLLPPFLVLGWSCSLPQPPPDTHCLRAGAPVLPETGSRGDSGLPLLICDSSIHTEKHRGLLGPGWGAAGTPLGSATPMLS